MSEQSEHAHAATVMKDEANVVSKSVRIPPYEELANMKTKIDIELEGMVGDDTEPSYHSQG